MHVRITGNGLATINNHLLAGHEIAGRRAEEYRGAGDLVGDADAQERRPGGRGLQGLRIVPQRLRKVGLDQAGRDAIHAHIVRAVFAGEIARQLHVGSLGDRVGAEDGRALQAADRRDDDDRAVLARDHLRHDHADEPVVGDDVVIENLAELIVGDAGERAVIRVGRGVADQHVDLAVDAVGLVDEILQILLAGDVGGDRGRRAGAVCPGAGHVGRLV